VYKANCMGVGRLPRMALQVGVFPDENMRFGG